MNVARSIGLSLVIASCGSDSSHLNKDAAAGNKDAPGLGHDAYVTWDLPVPSPEAFPDQPTAKDAPVAIDLAKADLGSDVGLDAAAKDTAEGPAAVDTQVDSVTVDLGTSLDGAPPDLDAQVVDVPALPAKIGFPCRNDGDCCIEIDSCMNVAYLYSKAPGAEPMPPIEPSSNGVCTACIPPAIQVSCVSGQCVGTKISTYSGPLTRGHCSYVSITDGGAHAPQKLDAGTVTTKAVWTCGGG